MEEIQNYLSPFGQTGDAFFIIISRFFIKIGRIKEDQIGFFFCATCATVKPRDKSAFAEFGNAAIFGKWYWKDVRARPNLFAILSWGMPRRCMQNILMSRSMFFRS
jgi:hypothetical protein